MAGSETINENKHSIKHVMLHRNGYFRSVAFTFSEFTLIVDIRSQNHLRKFQDDYSNDIALILLKTKIIFDNYAGNEFFSGTHFRPSLPVITFGFPIKHGYMTPNGA